MATGDLAIGAPSPGDLALPAPELNRILTAYLNPLLRFEEAAEALNLTLLDFIAQLNHPDVERAIATIAAAKAKRAEHLALCAHDSAVAALIRIIDSDKATGPVRAAAASLLRRIRESTSTAGPKPPPPRGESRGESLDQPNSLDANPSPHPGGEGEDVVAQRRQVRGESSADSRLTHPKPQTPNPKPDSQGDADESTTAHIRPSAGVPP